MLEAVLLAPDQSAAAPRSGPDFLPHLPVDDGRGAEGEPAGLGQDQGSGLVAERTRGRREYSAFSTAGLTAVGAFVVKLRRDASNATYRTTSVRLPRAAA